MAKKLTVADLLAGKGEKQRTQIFTMDPVEAAAAEAAGIEMLVTLDRLVPTIRAAAPHVFLTGGMVGDYGASEERAVSAAYQVMNDGGDAVYTSANLRRVKEMADEWIPVVGHVGYVPYRSTWFGGARAVGKTAAEARQVLDQTRRYESAGAIGVEMEVVPHQMASEIARRVSILIISMGAGVGGDAQYLFAQDVLGTNTGHVPRHAKQYGELKPELDRLQQLRIDAFAAFKKDVDSGGYPASDHLVEADPDELRRFQQELGTS
jgi:3-methyl-2-oxobutanoate hydroxymethyltransferase